MNKNEFEHILKGLSDDFSVPVSEGAFNRVMQKRQQQKKKRRAWFALFAVVVVAGLAGSTAYWLSESKQESRAIVSAASEQEPGKETNKKLQETPSATRKPEQNGYTDVPGPLNASGAREIQPRLRGTSPLNPAVEKAAEELPGKTINKKGQDHVLAGHSNGIPASPGKVDVMPSDRMEKILVKQEIPEEHPGAGRAAVDSSVAIAKTTDTTSDALAKIADTISPPLAAAKDPDSLALAVSEPGPEMKGRAQAHRWMIGVYGDYTPVTTARNANSAIPFPHPDSLGLSDKAVHGFSVGVKVGYAIHDHISLSIGFGYNKIQFEEVRFASVKVDSATFELVNNGATTKSKVVYPQNISDRSLSALQVPVGITYHTMLSKRIGFYAQAGVLYQYIFRSKGYEFTSSEDDNLSYREVTSKGLDRLNRNQFAWYAEPGLELLLSPRLRYQLGIVYRKHVTSLYDKEYIRLSAPAFMGFSTALRFNF